MVPSQTLPQGGKVAPNGILSWGATLYDFYSFQPVPVIPNANTYLSGSRITAAVRQIGELEYAKDELEWADNEDDPREIPVANTGELVECCEAQPTYGISSVLMFDRPLSSPFNPSHYPAPWPFIPFANPSPPVLLQERIPVHLLPQTLYVHDPYSLLHVDLGRNTNNNKMPWINMRPKVYLYTLGLGSSSLKAVEESWKAAEESERKKKRTLDVYRFPPTEEERPQGEPAYEVALPTKPSALTCVEEAHLYLSPAGKLGEGNHSIVYRAEWELPRELFVEPRLCHSCVYERLMGEMPVPPDADEEFDTERVILLKPQSNSTQKQATPSSISSSEGLTVFRVYCPNLRWQTPADPSTRCSHSVFRTNHLIPCTSTFQVAAKLSIRHDSYPSREAQNYQAFPDHLFQHWNGYNLIRPIHNPVPLHAVVPQFYGYYIPIEEVALSTSGKSTVEIDKEKTTAEAAADTIHTDKIPDENTSQSQPPPYLSLILLLEHCSQPVHLSSLSEGDREECASLCLRFDQAGWLHESIALRNVLVSQAYPHSDLSSMTVPNAIPKYRRVSG
ncbi:hypothetical protein F5141DRAFT_1008706 [Pisolithus sp. B1]|nr:hypothetical protein F5141DRAFT_1008706 [Pisolithus sp. B1]